MNASRREAMSESGKKEMKQDGVYRVRTMWTMMVGVPLLSLLLVLALAGLVAAAFGENWQWAAPIWIWWFLAPLGVLFLAYGAHVVSIRARRRNGDLIVGYLETAVRLNLPLLPFLDAAQRSETGARRRQMLHLTRELAEGKSMAAALRELPDVTAETAARVEAYEEIGQAGRGLGLTVQKATERAAAEAGRQEAGFYRFYGAFLIFAMAMLGTFYAIMLFPKFIEIFKDFKTDLPWITRVMFGYSSTLAAIWPVMLVVSVLVALGVLVLMAALMNRIFAPFAPVSALERWIRGAAWRTPLVRMLERDRGMADVCELLAEAVRLGIPLPAALQQARELDVNQGLRRQVARFQEGLMKGTPAGKAAADAGLPELLSGMLSPGNGRSEAAAASSEMFAFLARYYRQRFSRMAMLIRAAGEPVIVLIFGGMVMMIVLALMLPLVRLIDSVIQQSGGPL